MQGAAWLMVYVFPAIAIEPLLAAPVFAVTVIVTVPVPVPPVVDRLSQERLSDAVQAQLGLEVETNTVVVPPLDVKEPLEEEILLVQEAPPLKNFLATVHLLQPLLLPARTIQ